MQYSYIIIDSENKVIEKKEFLNSFNELLCLGIYNDYDASFNAILERKPDLIFFNFNEDIPISLLSELLNYSDNTPYVIGINAEERAAYQAIKHNISDFMLFPLKEAEIRKCILKFLKATKKKKLEKICVKTSGDYNFINLSDILFVKADNNTTDFYLNTGKIITGFKTMKHYESALPFYFFRIHNSYIVNINHISRINVSKSSVFLNNDHQIPYSRSHKDTIDIIIDKIEN